jgi:hypothetical protein
MGILARQNSNSAQHRRLPSIQIPVYMYILYNKPCFEISHVIKKELPMPKQQPNQAHSGLQVLVPSLKVVDCCTTGSQVLLLE